MIVRRQDAHHKFMSISKKIVLVLGVVWCCICSLFPPRQYAGSLSDARIIPTHEFLFSPDFQKFYFQQGLGNYYSVDVNCGRLLAELVLIAAATAVAFLFVEPVVRGLQGLPPNKSPEPTAVGAVSSAVAVHAASRRWLSFFR